MSFIDSSPIDPTEEIKMEYAVDTIIEEHAATLHTMKYAEETNSQKQQNLQLKTRIKSKLLNVIHSTSFCGLCLETDGLILLELEKSIHLGNKESLEEIILKVFGDEIMDEMPSNQICGACKDNVEHAYHFMSEVTATTKILRNYLEQIVVNIEEVDTMMVTPDCNIGNIIIVLQQDYDNKEITDKSVKIAKSKVMDEDSYEENTEYKMKDIFQCNICDKIFRSKKYLQVHIKKHHLQNRSKVSLSKEPCLECKGPCEHEKYLHAIKKQKERQIGPPYVLSCVDCNYKCTNKSSYLGHVNKYHLNKYPYLCENCGQKFHSRMALCIHSKVNHPTCSDCYYCDLTFSSREELFTHTQRCMKIQRAHKCTICPASFDQAESLIKHINNHERESTCQICFKTFHNVSTYRRHMSSAHRENRLTNLTIQREFNKMKPRNKLRNCSICKAVTFSSLKEWKAHMESHDPEETHKCFTCDKEYTDFKVYQKHLKSYTHLLKVDPNTKFAFACNVCDYTAQTNRDLESHKNIKHLKQKPHQCHLCEKSFATRDNLKGHQVRHTGIKSFKCDECNSVFSSTTGLKKHCFRNHSIGDHYVCNVCGKTFLYISLYELHVKRNHSEATEMCPLCKGAYHTNHNLRQHLLNVHAKGRDIQQFIMEENLEEVFRDRRLQHLD